MLARCRPGVVPADPPAVVEVPAVQFQHGRNRGALHGGLCVRVVSEREGQGVHAAVRDGRALEAADLTRDHAPDSPASPPPARSSSRSAGLVACGVLPGVPYVTNTQTRPTSAITPCSGGP